MDCGNISLQRQKKLSPFSEDHFKLAEKIQKTSNHWTF